ncbi:hypothetical protein PROFUN_14116 [Planoprotostelium fungivorum]|uniref:Uncharacterized protein n=1 Tax=Planoprotostelium fungivorum TaxID=1890364 RepID=A0A2P6N1C7_9EUKA|nr:hypothetical protein PROFUN_14116 [Planoprotostelium fungivorum]
MHSRKLGRAFSCDDLEHSNLQSNNATESFWRLVVQTPAYQTMLMIPLKTLSILKRAVRISSLWSLSQDNFSVRSMGVVKMNPTWLHTCNLIHWPNLLKY